MAAQRTISDVYADRELTDAQVRRLFALLGLGRDRRQQNGAEVAPSTPPTESTQQAS
ncbi:hypothetical protein J7E87_19910 [Streptomyces sp. ISL-1]|uniref:hypothetical protein n=1 Tax=Streptomyces sp. ISL-1 TaxID=2817657 RepID=UPI001BE9D788|nr:hypothetical protein [Streptomyces sp. ISL-1]MBT2391636.1 hypothetical protein [Streptomyces sp. ISL-1]